MHTLSPCSKVSVHRAHLSSKPTMITGAGSRGVAGSDVADGGPIGGGTTGMFGNNSEASTGAILGLLVRRCLSFHAVLLPPFLVHLFPLAVLFCQ